MRIVITAYEDSWLYKYIDCEYEYAKIFPSDTSISNFILEAKKEQMKLDDNK